MSSIKYECYYAQYQAEPSAASKPLPSNGLLQGAALLDNMTPRRSALNPAAGPPGGPSGRRRTVARSWTRKLCQVGGLNQNYTSAAGTLYHIQIEDRGPVVDRVVRERGAPRQRDRLRELRRAQRPHRPRPRPRLPRHPHARSTTASSRRRIAELAAEARRVIEEARAAAGHADQGPDPRVLPHQERGREEGVRGGERALPVPLLAGLAGAAATSARPRPPAAAGPPRASAEPRWRRRSRRCSTRSTAEPARAGAVEIERMIIELGDGPRSGSRPAGKADDILLQTCRKLVARAQGEPGRARASEFNARRLEMTRNSLITTWRQVQSRG